MDGSLYRKAFCVNLNWMKYISWFIRNTEIKKLQRPPWRHAIWATRRQTVPTLVHPHYHTETPVGCTNFKVKDLHLADFSTKKNSRCALDRSQTITINNTWATIAGITWRKWKEVNCFQADGLGRLPICLSECITKWIC